MIVGATARLAARPLRVMGIESSCDETAVGIVDGERRILADLVRSQIDQHRLYGGVVPELAARAHLEALPGLIETALEQAGLGFADLDGIAAAAGPGLIGGVLIGVTAAKAIAFARSLPFMAVNHLEGHALTARLTDDVAFPFLLLLVSGGHCQLLIVEQVGRYRRLGTTIDDAVGEAFDKAAKLMGLGYPGGPALEQAAYGARAPERFALPRPMVGRPDCHFSFSGLKSAVRRCLETLPLPAGDGDSAEARSGPQPTPEDIADLAAAFHRAVGDSLVDRCRRAIGLFRAQCPEGTRLVVAGGVAANRILRARLAALAAEEGLVFVAPPLALCTDNGAMIAWAGLERLRLGLIDGLDVAPRPRWPLDPTAPPARGAGCKA